MTTRGCTSGCLECYFRFIEDEALSFVPEDKRWMIRRMHYNLRARGMPVVGVNTVAAFELEVCRHHCPSDVVVRIEADQVKLGLGAHGQAIAG